MSTLMFSIILLDFSGLVKDMKRQCSTKMYYEKTTLDSFELGADFSWTLKHSGL